MRIIPAPSDSFAAGQPLPFALRDSKGRLLLARGEIVPSEAHAKALAARGMWVDADEASAHLRKFAGQLDQMVRRDTLLGQIAQARPLSEPVEGERDKSAGLKEVNWPDLVLCLNTLLRDPHKEDFVARIERLLDDVIAQLQRNPDRVLLALVHVASQDPTHYAASHSLLVMAVCELAALCVPHWEPPLRKSLGLAALTMNISMAAMQNQLALQDNAPSAEQRLQIDGHAAASSELLQALGVNDCIWLEAVAHHHEGAPGPLASRPFARQLARMIQRADVFAARLSPRRKRVALSAAAAAQVAYLDENKQPDEAGMMLIKAIGIYPPGCLVQLASGEIAVAVRRGAKADRPIAAAVIGKSGSPLGVPSLRDTQNPTHAVLRSMAPHEVKLRLQLETLMKVG